MKSHSYCTVKELARLAQQPEHRVKELVADLSIQPARIIQGTALYDPSVLNRLRSYLEPGAIIGNFSTGKGWIRGS